MKKFLILVVLILAISAVVIGTIAYHFLHRTEHFYFDSDGVKIHYNVEGKGEPVILVHGFAVNADLNWSTQGVNKLLSKHYKVITFDNRGHGFSGKPHNQEAYGAQMAKDVVNLMDHLGIKKAHLVGYSLGGFIALKCAVDYPDRWYTLTIMGSAWENNTHGRAFRALKMVEEAYEDGKPLTAAMNYFEGRKTPFWMNFLVSYMGNTLNDPQALLAVIKGLNGLIITKEQLQNIKIPMKGIVGDKDPFLQSAKDMTNMLSNYKLTIVDHANHLTTPRKKQAQEALLNFLMEHSA